MPRRSAKGKIKICKALNLDGTKCNKEFEVHQHQASKHKFCSDKCRKRDHRLKKKKMQKREATKLKKVANDRKHSESIYGKLQASYNVSMTIFQDIENLFIPIGQLPKKKFNHKDFNGVNGPILFNNYNQRREQLKLREKERKQYLDVHLNQMKAQLNISMNEFSNHLNSNELNLIMNARNKAITDDMKNELLSKCDKLNIIAPNSLKTLKTDNISFFTNTLKSVKNNT